MKTEVEKLESSAVRPPPLALQPCPMCGRRDLAFVRFVGPKLGVFRCHGCSTVNGVGSATVLPVNFGPAEGSG